MNVRVYKSGNLYEIYEIDARSHKQAVAKSPNANKTFTVSNGKKVMRYNNQGRPLKLATPRIFRYGQSGKYGILLMIGNRNEKYVYKTPMQREETFKKCTDLLSASYANLQKQLTSITACLEETRDLQGILTYKKTLNPSVEPAINPEYRTLTNTDWFSGRNNAGALDKNTCRRGSRVFPWLKSPRHNICALVKKLPRRAPVPGVTDEMKHLQKTLVALKKNHSHYLSAKNYLWRQEWLQFVAIYKDQVILLEPLETPYTWKSGNMTFKSSDLNFHVTREDIDE